MSMFEIIGLVYLVSWIIMEIPYVYKFKKLWIIDSNDRLTGILVLPLLVFFMIWNYIFPDNNGE